MFIKKYSARLMAFAMASTLAFSGALCMPTNAKASSDPATVEVLGATLRLDGNSGTQSMRFGIKINNASQAGACGIKLTKGSKTYTIATNATDGADSKKATNIFNYDSINDTVTYTVVLTGIPETAFSEDIAVQGIVNQIDTTTEETSGTPVNKSVSGIVAKLQETDNSISLKNGNLVRTVDGVDIQLRADDKIFSNDLSTPKKETAYEIGKQIDFSGSTDWFAVALDTAIQIKKTDVVEAIFSVQTGDTDADLKDDTVSTFNIALSPLGTEDNIAYKIQEGSTLRTTDSTPSGKVTLNKTSKFQNNYATIKSIATQSISTISASKAIINLEKIIVTPTDEIACTLNAPGTFDLNENTDVNVDVADEYDTITWQSSDNAIATVEASLDPTKAVVYGVKEGDVTITATVQKGSKTTKVSVDRKVLLNYKNKPLKLDLSQVETSAGATVTKDNENNSFTITTGGEVAIPFPYTLTNSEKIKVTVKGQFLSDNASFRLYPSSNYMTGESTYTFGYLKKTGYEANWDIPAEIKPIQEAACTINETDGTFEVKDLEFEMKSNVSAPVKNLLFRQATNNIKITEITVTYL